MLNIHMQEMLHFEKLIYLEDTEEDSYMESYEEILREVNIRNSERKEREAQDKE